MQKTSPLRKKVRAREGPRVAGTWPTARAGSVLDGLPRLHSRRPLATFLASLGFLTGLAACAEPNFLSFEELTVLSTTASPQGKLSERLHHLLSTPIVENGASAKGIRPHRPNEGTLGPIVRAAFWNIERG